MGKRTWTDEDIALLAKLNKERVPLTEMAKRLGRSYTALVNFRCVNGITYPDVISKQDMEKAIELRKRGYPCSKIAKRFNVSAFFMTKHLKDITPICSGSVWNLDMVDKLENAIMNSKSLSEVAAKIGKTLSSVKDSCILHYGTIRIDELQKEVQEYSINDNNI